MISNERWRLALCAGLGMGVRRPAGLQWHSFCTNREDTRSFTGLAERRSCKGGRNLSRSATQDGVLKNHIYYYWHDYGASTSRWLTDTTSCK